MVASLIFFLILRAPVGSPPAGRSVPALIRAGQNPPMPWFIKTETIRFPPAEVAPQLAAHRAWVAQLRRRGVRISSGYLVDGAGRPGGGGLLLLEAADYAAAEALIREDPMLTSGVVDWKLHQWIGAVGELAVL
jgi:uncharacterized protein YciI